MKSKTIVALTLLCVAGPLLCDAVSQRKLSISTDDARRALAEVASQQAFPAKFKVLKMGSIKIEGFYYHVFSTYLKERQKWRALVFDNTGRYLGFYETEEEPIELDANGIVFASSSTDSETDEDGNTSAGSFFTEVGEFTRDGPPDVLELDDVSFSFVSSPARILPDSPAYRYVQVADRLKEAMNRRHYRDIRKEFDEEAREKLSEEQTKSVFSNLRGRLGELTRLDPPRLQLPDTAIFPATFKHDVVGLKLMLDDEDEIVGLWLLPYEMAFPDIGEHKTRLSLPFNGRWWVLWGGDAKENNPYHGSLGRKHALQFVIADRYGNRHLEEGKRNEDYFAYGRTVVAPAAGTVVDVVTGIEENLPGSPNPYSLLGNMIMIRHATNEYSVLGHLMEGSVLVSEGDQVAARQPLALCGNSGNTTEPRLHFHMQDSPNLQLGTGYPLGFEKLLIWDKGRAEVVDRHSPQRGQYVEQQVVPLQEGSAPGNRTNPKPRGE